jgi:hypothetical protein
MTVAKERRRSRRRGLPFVRSAVLEVGERQHIVTLLDLGPDGAFLGTRLELAPETPLFLRLVVPRSGREVRLACRLVRRRARGEAGPEQPSGLAVRFESVDAASARLMQEFASEGFRPVAEEPRAQEHFEYRLVEARALDVAELNRLGLDGWLLAAALPSAGANRLIFVRRL